MQSLLNMDDNTFVRNTKQPAYNLNAKNLTPCLLDLTCFTYTNTVIPTFAFYM